MIEMIGVAVRTAAVWVAANGTPATAVVVHHGVFPSDAAAESRRGQFLTTLYDEKSRTLARAIDTEREWQRIRRDLRTPYRSDVSDY